MIHTGIGPFRHRLRHLPRLRQVEPQPRRDAGQPRFVNHLDGDYTNGRCATSTGTFIPFSFKNTTFDVEASDVRTWRNRHVFSYGGNVRYNSFDCCSRRWAIRAPKPASTARTSGSSPSTSAPSSGRASTSSRLDLRSRVRPCRSRSCTSRRQSQTVRTSFNRAYRAPSHVNNYLDVTLANAARSRRPQSGAGRPAVHLPERRRSAMRT